MAPPSVPQQAVSNPTHYATLSSDTAGRRTKPSRRSHQHSPIRSGSSTDPRHGPGPRGGLADLSTRPSGRNAPPESDQRACPQAAARAPGRGRLSRRCRVGRAPTDAPGQAPRRRSSSASAASRAARHDRRALLNFTARSRSVHSPIYRSSSSLDMAATSSCRRRSAGSMVRSSA